MRELLSKGVPFLWPRIKGRRTRLFPPTYQQIVEKFRFRVQIYGLKLWLGKIPKLETTPAYFSATSDGSIWCRWQLATTTPEEIDSLSFRNKKEVRPSVVGGAEVGRRKKLCLLWL
ncbi:unnamed protein product [Linum trigynum]|uniref:Uncharacterized protein n=1 Tax=Linum trigynum TaxID=586398 RepID=A0AAV2CHT1_9ROSI